MTTRQAIKPDPISSTPIKVPTLTLVLDAGTSCLKTIYFKGRRGKPKHLVSSSLICPTNIEPSAAESYIKLSKDENFYLVGDSAVQAKVQTSIKQLKSESLIPKVLGVIGQIAKNESLSNQFKLDTTLLLPMSEMNDQDFIKSELTEALSNFEYSGQSYKVDICGVKFKPEGNGVYTYISRSFSQDKKDHQKSAYLMFGYRNTSLLLIENDKFNYSNSHSTDLGFYNYLDLVAKYSSGLYRDDIQGAIVTEAVYGVNGQSQQIIRDFTSRIRIEDLIRSSNPKHRERELTSISAAIERADTEYWQLLSRWLFEKLPPLNQLDQVIYCGGSTSFIEAPINDFFKDWKGKLMNTNAMSIKMLEKLELTQASSNKFIEQYLPVRLADAWGEFVDLSGIKI